ncbi:MAG TPA: biotin/lipoyl-binding protein, partial [Coleofasciculaceae cyanobacterium]
MNGLSQNTNPGLLRPIESDEFLPPISHWTTLGGLVLVGTFVAGIALATVTKYSVSVKAAATVRPSGERRIVQAATEGVVKTIAVKENQVVKKGDVIAYLDDSRFQIQKSQLAGTIQQSHLQLATMAAQIKSLDTQIAAESSLMQRNIASAEADLSRNQREYKDRQAITQTDVTEAEAARELAQAQMAQYQKLASTGAIP